MRKQNKWTQGETELVFPPLPDELRGVSGAAINQATIDPGVGTEYYVAILDDRPWLTQISSSRPLKMLCKKGLARTDHGMLVFSKRPVNPPRREASSP